MARGPNGAGAPISRFDWAHDAMTVVALPTVRSPWSRLVTYAVQCAGATLALACVGAGFLTYAAMSGLTPLSGDPEAILILLYVDLLLLLAVVVFIVRRAVALWAARRRGSAGSQLHVRLVLMFAALALTPTIIVSGFSLLFLDLGMESWFNVRVRTALSESRAVAEAYLLEHQKTIRADALRIAGELNRDATALDANLSRLERVLQRHAALSGLSEALVFSPVAGVKARAGLTYALELESLPIRVLEEAEDSGVVLLDTGQDDRVRALARLDDFPDGAFLIVGRYVDPRVLARIRRTRDAVREFERLEKQRSDVQISFALAFLLVSLLLLAAAVWTALSFAVRLTRPLSDLIAATDRVRDGDLSVRVAELSGAGELGALSNAFNRMTDQLARQRNALVSANRQVDERRRFIEAVLKGVSAGVIGLDARGAVTLSNHPAAALLDLAPDALIGRPLAAVAPVLASLLEGHAGLLESVETTVSLERPDGTRTLLVRIAAERAGDAGAGAVLTFDDITELLAAQRKAAWSDVARRIAHEIKNPLTPIQLAAERLKRRYLPEIRKDPEIFSQCVETIIRQVGDIGRLVGAFSNFARMPKPEMAWRDLLPLCRQAVFMQSTAAPDVDYVTDLPAEPTLLLCDPQQIGQALTNVLQNALQAIRERVAAVTPGRIVLIVTRDTDALTVTVRDNGRGLPARDRERLMEPYVTGRPSGVGLGLAIVSRIVEDHHGRLTLSEEDGETVVRLVFAAATPSPTTTTAKDE